MALANCPTCRKKFDPQHSRALPFCSDRCRQIDLGRWLNEDISIPVSKEGDGDDRPPTPDEADDD
jgi:hypothetical protein